MTYQDLKTKLENLGLAKIAGIGDYGSVEIGNGEAVLVPFLLIESSLILLQDNMNDGTMSVHYENGFDEFYRHRKERPLCLIYAEKEKEYFIVYGGKNDKEKAANSGC